MVLKVCDSIKIAFSESRARTLDSNRPWNFDMPVVFGRLDAFEKRVSEVLLLFEAIVDFNKLEKIDVGGTKVCFERWYLLFCRNLIL